MKKSLVNHLVSNGFTEGITVDPDMFKEVYRSKYGKVRVYQIIGVDQESKKWAADPKHRDCDVEGGWYCKGRYPPALSQFIKQGKDFVQLEDFNKKDADDEYQKQYFQGMKDKDDRAKAQQQNMKKQNGAVKRPNNNDQL